MLNDKQKKDVSFAVFTVGGAILLIVLIAVFSRMEHTPTAAPYLTGEAAYKGRLPEVKDRPALKVLFIGNSYTMWHSMTDMIPWIAASVKAEHYSYVPELVAQGGAKLIDFAQNRELMEQIGKNHYAAIVLQEQSAAALIPEEAHYSIAAVRVFALAAQNTGAVPFIYGTWPRREGDPLYTKLMKSGTPDEMQWAIDKMNSDAAAKSGALYLPVGKFWRSAQLSKPALNLYMEDGSHPNVAGSYLAALVIYHGLSQRDPRLVTWAPDSLTAEDAAFLRAVAAQKLP